MAPNWEKKFNDLKEKEEEQLRADVSQLKQVGEEIKNEVRAVKDETKKLADHVAGQNGRISKLETIVGRRINFNNPMLLRTAQIIFIATAVIVVVSVAGGEGLKSLTKWLPGS